MMNDCTFALHSSQLRSPSVVLMCDVVIVLKFPFENGKRKKYC